MTRNCSTLFTWILVIPFLQFYSIQDSFGQSSLNNGLVVYYPFNGNADDVTGHEVHGTVYGATLTTDRFGTSNSAYYFDGTNDYIQANATTFPTGERTVSLWFWADDLDLGRYILGYGGGTGCGSSFIEQLHVCANWESYDVQGHCNNHDLQYPYGPPPVGRWIHWVVTTKPAGTNIYIDGENKAGGPDFFHDTHVAGTDLAIGAGVNHDGIAPYADGCVWYFKGKIDDIRIYDRALSDAEILSLYNHQSLTWTGSTSSDWTVASNWVPQIVPNGLADLTISPAPTNPVTITSPLSCTNLTLESGASLLGNEWMTVSGISTIKRQITGNPALDQYAYHLVSVPLTAASNPTSQLFSGSYLFDFNVSDNSWNTMGSSTTTPLSVTKGYMIYYPGASKTYQFVGNLQHGEFSPTLVDAGSGFNLIPNPYPSAIDWDDADWTKSNVANAIWFWPSGGANYASYVDGVSTLGGSKYIPSCQAFFVQVTGSNPVLTMNDDVRVHNGQPFWKSTSSEPNVLTVNVEANGFSDEAVVRFKEEATNSFDPLSDASKLFGLDGAPQLYTVTEENHKLTINSLPVTHQSIDVNMNLDISVTSDATITFSGMNSFHPHSTLFLEDHLSGGVINLKQQSTYSFLFNPLSTVSPRFSLHFNGLTGLEEVTSGIHKMWISGDKIIISSTPGEEREGTIEVYNLLGQRLYRTSIPIGPSTVIHPEVSGFVVVELTTDDGVMIAKGVID